MKPNLNEFGFEILESAEEIKEVEEIRPNTTTKKEWKLIINNQEVELQLVKKSGTCWNCQEYKEIRIISERKNSINGWEMRKFCGDCSLNNLQQLEDAEIENKTQIINELRKELTNYE